MKYPTRAFFRTATTLLFAGALAVPALAEPESLKLLRAEIADESGDGFVQPGEPAALRLTFQSLWASPARDLVATASANVPGVDIESPVALDDLPNATPGALVQVELPLSVSPEACGQGFAISLEVTARGNALARRTIPGLAGVRDIQAKALLDGNFAQLPDDGGFIRELFLAPPPGAATERAAIGVSIDHPSRGQLTVVSEAPSGTFLTLFDGEPGDDLDNLAAYFEVSDALKGQPAGGTYRLGVVDKVDDGGEVHFAKGWSLFAEYSVARCEPWTGKESSVMGFAPVPLEDWEFSSGDGAFFAPSFSSAAGGLAIAMPPEAPQSAAPFATGVWTSPRLDEFELSSGRLYAFRATISANRPPDSGAFARLRVEPQHGSIDHAFAINAAEAGPFAPPRPESKDYLFYARPFDLDSNGRNVFAFDAVDDGNPSGLPRAVTLHSLQASSRDADALEGVGVPLASFEQFMGWEYVNYGELSFGGLPVYEGGQGEIGPGGALRHLDDEGPVGGAAEWLYGEGPDQRIETVPGALYRARWTMAAEDGGDGAFPRARLAARSRHAALSAEYLVRGDGSAFRALDGQAGEFEQYWVGHDFEGPAGAENIKDDIALAFGLFNFGSNVAGRGGALELRALSLEMISPDDPNLP